MKFLYLIKYGELALKGKNRKIFEKRVIDNALYALREHNVRYEKLFGRFFIEAEVDSIEEKDTILKILSTNVFGLATVAVSETVENDLEKIKVKALEVANEYLKKNTPSNFKVEVKRPFKGFPLTSVETEREVGGYLHDSFGNLSVKLKNPDMTVHVEILEEYAFVYSEKVKAARGLPVGSSGKVGLFLSGGIDSPVAGYLAQKRGAYLNCIYFHSPPHTSEKAKQKVVDLAKKLLPYQRKMRMFVVNFTEVQLMLRKFTDIQYFVILGRRMMMRIANKLASEYGFKCFVTGENLGQVASQTLENLHCVNTVSNIPVLRPLICYDKDETVEIAKRIDTYETSILPYADCCTLFLPPNPNTKAKVKYLEMEEKKVDIEALAERAFNSVEIIDLV